MLRRLAGGLLLAGPVVLAFFSGGYFDGPRAWAGLAAWLLVAVGLVVGTLPRGRNAWLVLGGLAGLAAWTLLSVTWAPVRTWDAGQIVLLYLGATTAAALLAPERVEEALLLGAVVVVGYGVSERLLPGLLDFDRSVTAQGRLEQPLTYWNAMGLVAATGLVLSARADWRLACAPVLGLGLALTVSRGGLLAAVAGLVCLVVLARRRETLLAAGAVVGLGGLAALVAVPFETGAVLLVAVVVLTAAAIPAARACASRGGVLRLPAQAGVLAVMAVAVGFGLMLIFGSTESSGRLDTDASRLITLRSNRYEYWRVAARAFRTEPVRGVGAGGWAVEWRRERPFREAAGDAHSLPLQTLAELGLVGFALLGLFAAGVVLAARSGGAGAAGLTAVTATWGVHVLLDWDWEMPAATLPAMISAGVLVARSSGS